MRVQWRNFNCSNCCNCSNCPNESTRDNHKHAVALCPVSLRLSPGVITTNAVLLLLITEIMMQLRKVAKKKTIKAVR